MWHNDSEFWTLDALKTREFLEVEYVDENEDQNVDPTKILNYPPAASDLFSIPEDNITENDAQAEKSVKALYVRTLSRVYQL